MRIVLVFVFSFFWSVPFMAQDNFDVEILGNELLEQINEFRVIHELSTFSRNELLDAVAFDQAAHILKTNTLTHIQSNSKKAKLTDRILYYEGLFSQAGENIAQVGLNSKVLLVLGESKKVADTPEKMLLGAINSWLLEEEGALNLKDPNFLLCGISILENEKSELILVLVMASEPFEAPEGVKLSFNNYGVEPYSKESCDAFLAKHGSLSQLFSDGFKVENGLLRFQFNSLAFWDELMDNGKDGLAVELIARDQLSCSQTNRLFPGEIANGLLLKPVYKAKLSSLNAAAVENEVDFNLGKIPAFYNEAAYEINGMILKEGKKCVSIPFNKVKTENVRWLEIPFQNSVAKLDSTLTGQDTTQINCNQSSLNSDLERLVILLKGLQYEIQKLDVNIKLAPSSETSEQDIALRVKEILGPYFSSSVSLNYISSTDWEGYEKFKQGTFYMLETKDLTKEQEVEYLKETKKSDQDLKIALEELTQIELSIKGSYKLSRDLSYENRMQLLSVLIQKNKIDLALHYQNELITEAIRNEKELALLVSGDQKQLQQTLPLINNQIIAQHTLGERRFDGNPIHIAFLELYLINPNDPIIVYNYHLALLNFWAKSAKNISEIDNWKKGFEKIKSVPSISQEMYSKSILNYLIIAADYYYEEASFEKRKKAFDEMLRYTSIANLSDEHELLVAKYLCHQDQFPRAIKMLLPEVKKESISKEVLFYFLQIAIYDQEQVSEELYLNVLEKAQVLYPESFCALFSNKKMGIQQLVNPRIKDLYCNHCYK